MARQSKSAQQPTPSWDFLLPSMKLAWGQAYSLLWLALIPAILTEVGASQLNAVIRTNPTQTVQHALHSVPEVFLIVLAIGGFWRLIVTPASLVLGYKAVRGGDDHPWTYFKDSWHYFWRLWGLEIVVGLVILAGLIALIVPGLIFARRYILSPYFLIENDCGIFEAMRLSSKKGKPFAGYIWGSFGVMFVVTLSASIVGSFDYIGVLIGPIISLIYFFGFSLRQQEISKLSQR